MSRRNDKGYAKWKKPDHYCGGRFRIEKSRAVRGTSRTAERENREMDRRTGGIRVVPLPDAETAGSFRMPYGPYRGLTLAEILSGGPGRKADPSYIRRVADPRLKFPADAVRAACGLVRALDQGGCVEAKRPRRPGVQVGPTIPHAVECFGLPTGRVDPGRPHYAT